MRHSSALVNMRFQTLRSRRCFEMPWMMRWGVLLATQYCWAIDRMLFPVVRWWSAAAFTMWACSNHERGSRAEAREEFGVSIVAAGRLVTGTWQYGIIRRFMGSGGVGVWNSREAWSTLGVFSVQKIFLAPKRPSEYSVKIYIARNEFDGRRITLNEKRILRKSDFHYRTHSF